MTAFALKIIASATMLIDHTGVLFQYVFDTTVFRVIGRVAFPLYVFLVSEGCRHTRSIKKYFAGFVIFALISEIIFDMFFMTVYNFSIYETIYFDMTRQNVFFTLALGVLSVWYYDSHKMKDSRMIEPVHIVPLLIIFAAGYFLNTDYDSRGVIMIFLCCYFTERWQQALVLAASFIVLYHGDFGVYNLELMAGAMLSLPFILLYNGKRGYNKFKWIFYAFYPVHILILYFVWNFYVAKLL